MSYTRISTKKAMGILLDGGIVDTSSGQYKMIDNHLYYRKSNALVGTGRWIEPNLTLAAAFKQKWLWKEN